ncbi:MAG: flagellar FlbD family protein [Acidimicrobiales bacterium]
MDNPRRGNGATLIAVKKLDGAMMHLNEDLIERVENAAGGQSAVYLRYGGHMILANDPATVVEMIRAEKTALLRRVFDHPEGDAPAPPLAMTRDVTQLTQVHGR